MNGWMAFKENRIANTKTTKNQEEFSITIFQEIKRKFNDLTADDNYMMNVS